MYNKLLYVMGKYVGLLTEENTIFIEANDRGEYHFFFKCQLNLIFTDCKDSYSITIFH